MSVKNLLFCSLGFVVFLAVGIYLGNQLSPTKEEGPVVDRNELPVLPKAKMSLGNVQPLKGLAGEQKLPSGEVSLEAPANDPEPDADPQAIERRDAEEAQIRAIRTPPNLAALHIPTNH
jgi:hypothetical protein